MPHKTHAYQFEAKVVQFAADLSARFSGGSSLRSFLLTLDQQGNEMSLVFKEEATAWHERRQELESSEAPHIYYGPLDDGQEFFWLSWHRIDQSLMERLTGQRFIASDFQPHPEFGGRVGGQPAAELLPPSWGVMF